MKKFSVKFLREFEVDIEAEDTKIAEQLAQQILSQFPAGTVKLLSVIAEGAVVIADGEPSPPTKPWGSPNGGGGSPGTPIVRQEVLIDQIAEAA